MKSVLVLTHRNGFEADPVIDVLRKRDIPVFRFNCDDGEETSLASFISGDTTSSEIEFSCDKRRVKSSEIAVGWCQQMPPYSNQAANERESLQRKNLLALQSAVIDCLSIPWLNKPRYVAHASNKVNQLMAAKEIGLSIPKTVVSNDPSVVRRFALGRTIVAKNLATPWIVSPGQTRAAYTRIVKPEWLDDDNAISFAPIIYQEYCERSRDFRVVVVGNKFFPASCLPLPHQREDIREGCGTGDLFTPCDLDTNLLQKIRALMNVFSIDYCAADFMEDKHGNIFFLEMNTCGAWWWLDELYGNAICHAIVDKLEYLKGG